jgi:hypothetical protein
MTTDIPKPSQIEGLERMLGVKFPESYCLLIARFDGASGSARFAVATTTHDARIAAWLSVLPWHHHSVWSYLSGWGKRKLPETLVPFGNDGDGNYLCFDYRKSDVPVITMWYHELEGEEGLHTVAPSFDEFLKLLRADGA